MASSYFFLKLLKRRDRKQREAKNDERINGKSKKISLNLTATEERKCRVCLKNGKIPIYGNEHAPDISETIRTFGDIEVNQNDDYPKHLCDVCYSLLQSAVLFRKSAKESDKLLHQKPKPDLTFETEYNGNNSSDNEYDTSLKSANNDDTTKSFSCTLCKLSFRNSNEYLIHKSSKQHRNVRIQCHICFRLLTTQLYKRHLVRHQSATHLICEVCGKMYRKDNLVRHLQLHSFELPFHCQICPYRGRFMESLKIHMRTHTGDKPFSCDKCQLRFLTRSNLNRHLLTHRKDRPHKCVECGRGFYTMRDLEVHFKSDHAGVKDFGCRMCGNKYGTRKALMRHELRVHKRDKMAKGRMPLYLQSEYRKQSDGTLVGPLNRDHS